MAKRRDRSCCAAHTWKTRSIRDAWKFRTACKTCVASPISSSLALAKYSALGDVGHALQAARPGGGQTMRVLPYALCTWRPFQA